MSIGKTLAAAVFLAAFALPAPAADKVEQSLLADIRKAEQNLQATQRRVDGERRQVAERLNALERSVLELREKTAVARRLADENTLNLSQLEKRLESWREQHLYQQNLLQRFVRQHDVPIADDDDAGDDVTLQAQIAAISELVGSLDGRLHPAWRDNDVVLASGELEKMQTLAVGPVAWYLRGDGEAGMLDIDNGIARSGLAFGGSDRDGLQALATAGEGIITFDPSLSRAVVKAAQSESLVEHLVKGGMWVIPIILFALLALAIALLKGVQLWRLPAVAPIAPGKLQAQLAQAAPELTGSVTGMQQRLVKIAAATEKGQSRDDRLFTELQADRHWLERGIGVIAITASVAPLLGLLGTVSGMIEMFKMMTLFGSGDPEIVSGGISQALITTELGLVVAIPALIINAVLSRRAKSYYRELENFAIQLSQVDAGNPAEADSEQPVVFAKTAGAST